MICDCASSTSQSRGREDVRDPSPRKRDSGYSCVVLAASFVAQYLSMGLSIGGVGIMIVSFSKRHPDSDRAAVAWIGSLRSFQFLACPLAVLLSARFGYRVVTISGAAVSALGIALSSLATELWHVYLTYGILAGLGIACTYACSTTVLDEYFAEKKNVAFPVASLGSSLGILSAAYIVQTLLDSVGHEATLYITAGMKLVEAACGIAFRRNEKAAEAKADEVTCFRCCCCVRNRGRLSVPCCPLAGGRVRPNDDGAEAPADNTGGDVVITDYEDSQCCDRETTQSDGRDLHDNERPSFNSGGGARDARSAGGDAVRPSSLQATAGSAASEKAASALQLLRLMRHWRSWALAAHAACWGASVVAVESLAPAYAVGVGIDDRSAALGLTALGGGVVASTLAALAAGRRNYDRALLYGLASAAIGVVPLLLPLVVGESASAVAYAVLCAVYGLWLGALLSLYMSVLAEYGEPSPPQCDFAAHFAIYILFNGIGSLVGPAAIGAIQTILGDNAGWYVCGSLGIVSFLVMTPVYILRKMKQAQREQFRR